jgi:hypothetical protein
MVFVDDAKMKLLLLQEARGAAGVTEVVVGTGFVMADADLYYAELNPFYLWLLGFKMQERVDKAKKITG